MTHSRLARTAIRATFYACCLLSGTGVAAVADHTDLAATTLRCAMAADMAFNPCAELDTTQVEDLRGARIAFAHYVVLDMDNPDPVAECLLDRRWHGDPGDGQDWIYAPQGEIDRCVYVTGG